MTCCDGAPRHSMRELPTVCLLSSFPVTVYITRCRVHVAPHSSIQVCTGPCARSLMYNVCVLLQAGKKVPAQRGQMSLLTLSCEPPSLDQSCADWRPVTSGGSTLPPFTMPHHALSLYACPDSGPGSYSKYLQGTLDTLLREDL